MHKHIPVKSHAHTQYAIQLILAMLDDIGARQGFDVTLDKKEVINRVKAEGLSFLTKTLPKLGKAFDISLQGRTALGASNFKFKSTSKLPSFMYGLFSKILSKEGMIRDDADILAIKDVRQLTFMLYKLQTEYTDEQTSSKIKAFVEIDQSLHDGFDHLDIRGRIIMSRARHLLQLVLGDFTVDNCKPTHGPGAVGEGFQPFEKGYFDSWFDNSESVFPYWLWTLPSGASMFAIRDTLPKIALQRHDEGWSVLDTVPKDSRGPRIIGKEPRSLMWLQQGLKRYLYKHLETHPLTRGRVNFTDQTINGKLALKASKSGEFVTLDMDSASDRVALWLVKELFLNCGELLPALLASRSVGTVLPNGQKLRYRKFAPMGSAVCFPIEALVFWSLAAAAISLFDNMPVEQAGRCVYVYGDDIIIRREHLAAVSTTFPVFELKLSENKCCTAGFFRESCGVDAYYGENVTPIKVKHLPPINLFSTKLVSLCDYHAQMLSRGYKSTAQVIHSWISAIGDIPTVPSDVYNTKSYVAITADGWSLPKASKKKWKLRYSWDHQQWQVLALVPSSKKVYTCLLLPWCDIAQSLSKQMGEDSEQQWKTTLRYTSSLKFKWVPYDEPHRNLVSAGIRVLVSSLRPFRLLPGPPEDLKD